MISKKNELDKFFSEEKNRLNYNRHKIFEAADLSADKVSKLQDRLYRMIQYAIERHDWYDEQRHRFLQIGVALFAVSATISAVLVAVMKEMEGVTEILAWLSVGSLFLTAFYLIHTYTRGVERDHPYRRVVDIKSWYFKYNFPFGLKDQISRKPAQAKNQVKEVVDSFRVFLNRWFSLLKDNTSFVKEDLEQVFILQLLQRYGSQQVKRMSKGLFFGLLIAGLFLILSIVTYAIYHSQRDTVPYVSTYQAMQRQTDKLPPPKSKSKIFKKTKVNRLITPV
jgi:hypothetical protein